MIMDEVRSEYQYVRHGVPQGSTLSSILFLLFINDIFDLRLRGKLQLFADDAILIHANKNCLRLHQLINEWFYENLLTLNVEKTKFIFFKTRNKPLTELPPVFIDGTEIERVSHNKYLGLMLDEQLNWGHHISLIRKTVNPYLCMLRRTAYLLPSCTRLSVYYSYIHCHFMYLISLWGFTTDYNLTDLQVLQNKAIRAIFWQEYQEPSVNTDSLFNKYRILKIRELVKYDCLNVIFKFRNGLLKCNQSLNLRTFRDNYREENDQRIATRNFIQARYVIPRARLNILRDTLLSRGLTWYNELPYNIISETRFLTFKYNLKRYILNETMH